MVTDARRLVESRSFVLTALLLLCPTRVSAFMPGLYCGTDNCYDVLGVTRDSEKNEIAKAYRKLAAQWHPDRARGEAAKKSAEEKFRSIASAYEVLKDEQTRKDYDYMLDNPEAYYYNYYTYYRRRVAPKVDVRLVIVSTIIVISMVQFLSARHKYNEAIAYLLSQPKYRLQAVEIANERGLLENTQRKGKRRQDKEVAKAKEEGVIRSILEENMDVRGGHQKPNILSTLAFQMLFCPYYGFLYVAWWLGWVWRFWIRNEEFGDEEKQYLIRKNLNISQSQFDCLSDKEKAEMYKEQLWDKAKFAAWKSAREQTEKLRMAESSQYKRYRRYMKNHGPGQISFADD